jgi:hypothetical protein
MAIFLLVTWVAKLRGLLVMFGVFASAVPLRTVCGVVSARVAEIQDSAVVSESNDWEPLLRGDFNVPEHTDFFVGWGTLSLINAGLAQSKGRSGLLWWVASLFFGPVATFLIVVLDPVGRAAAYAIPPVVK